MRAVVNASPLIFLSKLDRVDLLPKPALTTKTVLDEIRAGLKTGHPEALAVELAVKSGALAVANPRKHSIPHEAGLHAGEASVIGLALERRITEVVVDDRIAIRVAKLAGLKPISTPFLFLRCYRQGVLDQAAYRGLLARLVGHGYFLSAPLYERLTAETQRSSAT